MVGWLVGDDNEIDFGIVFVIHQNLSARAPHLNFFFNRANFYNMEPTTPTTEVTWEQCQKPTPVKARFQGAIDYEERRHYGQKRGCIPSQRCFARDWIQNTTMKQSAHIE